MALKDELWTLTSLQDFVLQFLRAEWESKYRSEHSNPVAEALVFRPDLKSEDENSARLQLLCDKRGEILSEIPTGTSWYRVRWLRPVHIGELRVINSPAWYFQDPRGRRRDLPFAARSKKEVGALHRPLSEVPPPVLFAPTQDGPFTILEGNHRLCGWAKTFEFASSAVEAGLEVEVVVGLSHEPCAFY